MKLFKVKLAGIASSDYFYNVVAENLNEAEDLATEVHKSKLRPDCITESVTLLEPNLILSKKIKIDE